MISAMNMMKPGEFAILVKNVTNSLPLYLPSSGGHCHGACNQAEDSFCHQGLGDCEPCSGYCGPSREQVPSSRCWQDCPGYLIKEYMDKSYSDLYAEQLASTVTTTPPPALMPTADSGTGGQHTTLLWLLGIFFALVILGSISLNIYLWLNNRKLKRGRVHRADEDSLEMQTSLPAANSSPSSGYNSSTNVSQPAGEVQGGVDGQMPLLSHSSGTANSSHSGNSSSLTGGQSQSRPRQDGYVPVSITDAADRAQEQEGQGAPGRRSPTTGANMPTSMDLNLESTSADQRSYVHGARDLSTHTSIHQPDSAQHYPPSGPIQPYPYIPPDPHRPVTTPIQESLE